MAKQRQIMIEQRGGMAAMQAMEKKSDAELEAETKHRSAAFAILGARAAERYDADASRLWFQKALAAARPQDRLALKRMADASIALAERRAGDLKIAVEKLGTEAPSGRQLFVLRLMGIIAPPKSASIVRRIGGPILLLLAIVVLIAAAAGLIFAIALPFGGIKFGEALLFGLLALAVGFGVLAVLGRRRQKQARQGL